MTSRTYRRLSLAVSVVALLALASCGSDGGEAASSSSTQAPSTSSTQARLGGRITVAAASDLRLAFADMATAFTAQTGTQVEFSFGSSGQLREQVVNGAPFDVYASADATYVDAVIDAGRGLAASKAGYGLGRLVLWAPAGKAIPASLDDLAETAYQRIAIANPEHAPYGRAAVEAMTSTGVYDSVRSRIVLGETIADTQRIVQSGNADVGIIALSLVITSGDHHTLIPDTAHQPIRQALVVTATGDQIERATAFATFVNSPAGREIMRRYGFALPGESLPGG